jgi:hypothetical protein
MALQQVSLSGVIICPVLELGQRLGVNSFTHQHRDGHHNRCGSEKSRSPFFPLRKRPGKFHSGACKTLKVVLTDHCFVIGVDRMQRNFEPMRETRRHLARGPTMVQ